MLLVVDADPILFWKQGCVNMYQLLVVVFSRQHSCQLDHLHHLYQHHPISILEIFVRGKHPTRDSLHTKTIGDWMTEDVSSPILSSGEFQMRHGLLSLIPGWMSIPVNIIGRSITQMHNWGFFLLWVNSETFFATSQISLQDTSFQTESIAARENGTN